MEARNRSLEAWLTRVRTRQLVLPRFQRMEAWSNREITDLLQMVVDGLPIGAALVLEVGDSLPFISRPLQTAPEFGERVSELLLDGQQRLTAMWRALHNNYPDRTYFVEWSEDDAGTAGEWTVVSVGRWTRNGTRYPVWADDWEQCWQRRYVPIHLLRPGAEAEAEADDWVQQVASTDIGLFKRLTKQVAALRAGVAGYNLPFLSLPVGTEPPVVLNVFIKLNTRSVKLTAFDIVVAQTEEATGESLHDMVGSLSAYAPALASYDEPQDIAMNVMALLQDRVPNQTGYLGMDFQRMTEDWSRMVAGAQAAVSFLEQERVFDGARLPTESILAPLVALWAQAPTAPDALGNMRIWLRQYLWRGFFTDRYERAAATAALQDYRALRDLILGKADDIPVPCLDEALHPLPTAAALVQASWPKKRDRLARAIMLLSLRGGAHDIADGASLTREHLARREYHHLFPVAYLRDGGIDEENAYRALNCALISWRTNRTISAKAPLAYLLERAEASTLGEAEIRNRLASHGIDYCSLSSGDYDAFLRTRAEKAETAIRALCDGKPWQPQVS